MAVRVRLCKRTTSVSELIDMRGSSGGRTVPKQCRSVAERYASAGRRAAVRVRHRKRRSSKSLAASLKLRGRPFPGRIVVVQLNRLTQHATQFSSGRTAARRRAVLRTGFPTSGSSSRSHQGRRARDAAPRVGDGARRRAVRVRAAGGRGSRAAGDRAGAPAAAGGWRAERTAGRRRAASRLVGATGGGGGRCGRSTA